MSWYRPNLFDLDHAGYTYRPWEDHEDDNIKIFHDLTDPDGKSVYAPWSPYKMPTVKEVELFIEDHNFRRLYKDFPHGVL